MRNRVFLDRLPPQASEKDIVEAFHGTAAVQFVKIMRHAQSGESRGFGFVDLASAQERERVVETVESGQFMYRLMDRMGGIHASSTPASERLNRRERRSMRRHRGRAAG